LPVVFVVSEIFGVHEYIADVARRFAKMGYLAIAPEFFVRAGDPNTIGTMAEILKEIVGKTPDDAVRRLKSKLFGLLAEYMNNQKVNH